MIINSQLGGKKPTGTINITSNGTHDVTDYASADVNVPTSAIIKYGADVRAFLGDVDANGNLQGASTPTDLTFTGVKHLTSFSSTMGVLFRRFQNLQSIRDVSFPDLADIYVSYGMQNAFYMTSATSATFAALTEINANYAMDGAFYNCTALASVSFPLLTKIAGERAMHNAFNGDTALTTASFPSLTNVSGKEALNNAFYGCTALTTVDMHNLTNAQWAVDALTGTFKNCSSLTSINLDKLSSVYYMVECFYGCSSLTTLSLPELTTANACSSFAAGCSALTSVNLKKLEVIGTAGTAYANGLFQGCSSLVEIKFESLKQITHSSAPNLGQMFGQCTSLQNVWFYAFALSTFTYANEAEFQSWLTGVTGCTIHFPKVVQARLLSFNNVVNGLGGTNTTVLFDIVTSITGADSNVYARQQRDSTSTATAWVYNSTLYYTSGTAEPVVGDTIYSDAACTTSVTTISSIA